MRRKIRVLVAKPGLDGHDRGAKVVAAALRDAGMEVIYTGLHQTPEQVVEAAAQEDVDVVALSILSGAHMTLFPEVLELMKRRDIGALLTGGGIIPAEDMETLAKQGVGRLFGPGASTRDIADYIRGWFVETHGAEALASPRASEPNAAAPRTRAELTVRFASGRGAKPKRAARAKTVAKARRTVKRARASAAKRGAQAKRRPAKRTARARR